MYFKPTIRKEEIELLRCWLFETNGPHQYSFWGKDISILLQE